MNSTANRSIFDHLNRPAAVAILFVLLVAALSATAYRTIQNYSPPANHFDWGRRGHSDFHNGVYYPSLAFREGVNPYSLSATESYPLARSSPIYSPALFIWHQPFTWLDVRQADVAFFLFNAGLIGLLAWMGIAMSGARFQIGVWLLLFLALVVSRPGHITLFTGYFTLELVIGTIVALHFARTRPFVSGIGILLSSGKPTYALPLIALMLCRKNFRAVAIGVALCIAGGLIGLGWLACFSSPSEVVAGINEGRMALHDEPEEDPVNTWTRLDTVGVVSKVMNWKPDDAIYFVTMLGFLLIPGTAIWRLSGRENNQGGTGLSSLIVCLTVLISIYHHSYDGLLVAVPFFGLLFYQSIGRDEMPSSIRWVIVFCLAVPAGNYLSTRSFGQKFGLDPQGPTWEILTSANGASLLIALGLSVWCAWRAKLDIDRAVSRPMALTLDD